METEDHMTNLVDRLDADYLFGCIKYQGIYRLFALPFGWWILNYARYDPASSANEDAGNFRNGVFNVVDSEVGHFLHAIKDDNVTPAAFNLLVDVPAEQKRLQFFIDFDEKLFINGYYENVEPEEYLPDPAWQGKMGFPIDHLSKDFKNQFDGLS